jgi:hypothetical protein
MAPLIRRAISRGGVVATTARNAASSPSKSRKGGISTSSYDANEPSARIAHSNAHEVKAKARSGLDRVLRYEDVCAATALCGVESWPGLWEQHTGKCAWSTRSEMPGRLALGVGAGSRCPMADQRKDGAGAGTSGAMVARGND